MNKINYKEPIKPEQNHNQIDLGPYNTNFNHGNQKYTMLEHNNQETSKPNIINEKFAPISIHRNINSNTSNNNQSQQCLFIQRNAFHKAEKSESINNIRYNQNRIDKHQKIKEILMIIPHKIEISTFLSDNSHEYKQSLAKGSMKINKLTSDSVDAFTRQNGKSFMTDKLKGQKMYSNPKRQKSLISAANIRLLTQKSKLKPICKTESQIKDDRSPNQIVMIQQKMRNKFDSMKNERIIRQVIKIHEKNINSIKYRIGNVLDQKFYRMENGEVIENMFNIQSLEPINILENTSAKFRENKKRKRSNYKNIQENLLQLNSEEKKDNQIFLNSQSKKLLTQSQNHKNLSKFKQKFIIPKRYRKFIIPFQTYYYRDFLWKLNYSNSMIVEPPLQYEHRLKVFIGKGNNSSMVRGLISRRYWLATAQKVQDANFVWTQLKQFGYFKLQKELKEVKIRQCKMKTYASRKYLNCEDIIQIQNYLDVFLKSEEFSDERLIARQKHFEFDTILKADDIKNGKMHNHFKNNYIIANKKALYKILASYYMSHKIDPFTVIPITFHIKSGLQDEKFLEFQRYYHQRKRQIRRNNEFHNNLWIIKPGENSNRGFGIKLCLNLDQIKSIIKVRQKWPDGSDKTYIIQSYIQNPLLYQRRKFDFRHYMLVTCINGYIKGYWYEQGYVRTSSSQFNIKSNDSSIHLTNDAIQKYLPNYGKYQKGNKLSYEQINEYIAKKYQHKSFYQDVYPKMKNIAIDIMKSSAHYLDPEKLSNNFEIFGLDFMVDKNLKVWLLQVNSNPCLQLSCPILSMIIPNLVENVLQMTLDVMFPPAIRYSAKIPRYTSKIEQYNKFELIFDERIEPTEINQFDDVLDVNLLKEEDDFYEDDGSEWEQIM